MDKFLGEYNNHIHVINKVPEYRGLSDAFGDLYPEKTFHHLTTNYLNDFLFKVSKKLLNNKAFIAR